MSKDLSFRERLERQVNTKTVSPVPSGSPASVVLRLAGEVREPVTLIRTLATWGLGLKKGLDVTTRLTAGEQVPIVLSSAPAIAEMAATLAQLGIGLAVPEPPSDVDVKAIRDKMGLTQKEFAARFCFELSSVKNWEQARTVPDRTTRVLLKVSERNPEVVEAVLV